MGQTGDSASQCEGKVVKNASGRDLEGAGCGSRCSSSGAPLAGANIRCTSLHRCALTSAFASYQGLEPAGEPMDVTFSTSHASHIIPIIMSPTSLDSRKSRARCVLHFQGVG